MTLEELYEQVRILTERITVLEAERTSEKFIQPSYRERNKLIDKITKAQGDK
jgi:hypothetical protein